MNKLYFTSLQYIHDRCSALIPQRIGNAHATYQIKRARHTCRTLLLDTHGLGYNLSLRLMLGAQQVLDNLNG